MQSQPSKWHSNPTGVISVDGWLHHKGQGRLGNRVQQLLLALGLAEENGCRGIIAECDDERGAWGGAFPEFFRNTTTNMSCIYLNMPATAGTKQWKVGQVPYKKLSWEQMTRLARTHLIPLMRDPARGSWPSRRLSDGSVASNVVHLRSGDVFSGTFVPRYVQPPLSFFTTSIEQMQRSAGVQGVLVISEDRKHPMLPDLARLPGVEIQTEMPLQMDAHALLGASRVAWSFTSMSMLMLLRDTPYSAVWSWCNDDPPREPQCFVPRGLPAEVAAVLHSAYPKPDTYIRAMTWNSSSERQQQLLMNLPASDIIFSDAATVDLGGHTGRMRAPPDVPSQS